MFLDMINQHFDILWTYVESVNRTRKIEHKQKSGLSDELVERCHVHLDINQTHQSKSHLYGNFT